jgi:tetratricopeptide (TPR) repeat protein
VEAARLCALCAGGQILVADTVRAVSGRRSPHQFVSVGERELKGLPVPIEVCQITWEPVVTTAGIPLPDRLETPSGSLFGFFGRQQERDRLTESVKDAVEGSRNTVFLSGEPGIGKTSLSKQAAQSAHDLGVCVLYGRCDEDLGVSYKPFAEALSHLVVHADDDLLEAHVAEYAGALVSLVPALAKRIPDLPMTQGSDPDSERLQLFGAVVGLLASASSDAGLLLVLDDLHWADKASLQLLRHVCASTQLPNVMVLGTYRDSELSAGNALSDTLASLHREANAERIDLVGLADVEIVEMMEKVAGHEMNQDGVDLAHAVRRETEGNPFFTTELLRHLGESGLVHQDDTGRWVASDDLYEQGLPQSVREVVGQRVDRLGEDMRRVLSQAAVIGRDFDIEVLESIAGIDEDALLDLVDRGVQAGLLTEVEGTVERFSFAHALTQHTLYEDLGATRRGRVHRKVAEAMEQLYGGAPESRSADLARHFVAATKSADAMKAVHYSMLAGNQALAQLAPADALGWYTQALELYPQLVPDEDLHCDLLIGLGTAQRLTGDPAHRQTLIDAAALAVTAHDKERLVAAALANNRGGVSVSGQVDLERVAILEQALEAIGEDDTKDRALLLATLHAEMTYGEDRHRWAQLATDALAVAERLDDPVTQLRVILTVYQDYYLPDNVDDRLAAFAASLSIAENIGDKVAGLGVNYCWAVACLQAGDRVGLDRHLDDALSMAEHLGQPYESWKVTILRSLRSLLAGDVDAAEHHANGALALGTGSVPETMPVFGAQFVAIRTIQGRWDEIMEFAELLAAAAAESPGLPILRGSLAKCYCDIGRDEEARAVIAGDLEDGFIQFPYDVTWLSAMVRLAEVCTHLHELEGAARLYELLLPWHAQVATVSATAQGPVSLHLAMLASVLGRYETGEEHFREAMAMSERLKAPYWIARTQAEWSTSLRRQAVPDLLTRADVMRAAADGVADQFGFGGLKDRGASGGVDE